MNKCIKLLTFLLVVFIISFFSSHSNKIITNRKSYLTGLDGNISTRELALLTALSYSDVPSNENWQELYNNNCKISSNDNFIRKIKGNKCFFTQERNDDGTYKTITKGGYNVPYFIEGMSERRLNSLALNILSKRDDGQNYYFSKFADVDELKDKWSIYAYGIAKHSINNDESRPGWNNTFNEITYNRGNNYVISFRGTDMPDAAEWLLSDIAYSFDGTNIQTNDAYKYAQEQYDSIIHDNPIAKIYVTGHSLGAYLAQVGAAAIVDKEAGYNNLDGNKLIPIKSSDLKDYENIYRNNNSHLMQVAYFNGMGVNGMFSSSDLSLNIQNALIYLSTHDVNGEISNGSRYVNYSEKIKSSGRLVLYSMNEDPISNIGLHYGEIFKLEYAADEKTQYDNEEKQEKNLLELYKTLSEDNKEKINEYGEKEFIEAISRSIYNYIKNRSIAKEKSDDTKDMDIPLFVTNNVNGIEGKFKNFGAASVAVNLYNSIHNYINGKGLSGFKGYFGLNHKTNSYACLLDNNDGIYSGYLTDINGNLIEGKINLEINTNGTESNCLSGICNIDDKNNNYPITLKSNVSNACAKSYTWYYKLGDNDWKLIESTTNNTIYIKDLNKIMLDKDTINDYKFKVIISYGDRYTPKTLIADKINGSVVTYTLSNYSYNTNPTLNDGVRNYEDRLSAQKETNSLKIANYNDSIRIIGNGKINCVKNTCYTNDKYSSKNNIILKNEYNNHLWKYSLDGNTWHDFSNNKSNELQLDSKIFDSIKENETLIVYIRDYHDDIYDSTYINYVYDTTSPVCTFEYDKDKINVELEHKKFLNKKLSSYKEKNIQISFKCTDNLSDFNKNNISKKYFSIEDNGILNNGFLTKKIKITNNDIISYTSNNKINVKIPVSINDIPNKKVYIGYLGGIKDLAGNTSIPIYNNEGIYNNIYFNVYSRD